MFQSTRPQGARRTPGKLGNDDQAFQSTRPQGARLIVDDEIVDLVAFQSTRPQGARPGIPGSPASSFAVSIHAPAGGAT